MCYVTGSRADFGLIARALLLARASRRIDVAVCVTGMHLSPMFGNTVREVEATGLRICGRVPVEIERCTGESMARALGQELIGITEALLSDRPEVVMVLGDRGEMLAGALAASHLNIPIVHVHGGERSGTVDEPVRHAISKLSHYHFVATKGARERLIRMGERSEHVFVTGAPGLDGLKELAIHSRDKLCAQASLDPARLIALVLFHPVLQEVADAGRQAVAVMQSVLEIGLQAICLMPNADAGGRTVREVLGQYGGAPGIRLVAHLPRADFISWMVAADVMVGNSSSGIIEAASVGLRVVNVGTRQRLREQSGNVIDSAPEREDISAALHRALADGRYNGPNVYGDGNASSRIVDLLSQIRVDASVLHKTNAY